MSASQRLEPNPEVARPPILYVRVCVCACFSKVQLMSVHNEAKSLHCRTHIVAVCLLFGVFFYFFFLFISLFPSCLFVYFALLFCLSANAAYAQRALLCGTQLFRIHFNLCTKVALFNAFINECTHAPPATPTHTHTLAHADSCLLYCVFN